MSWVSARCRLASTTQVRLAVERAALYFDIAAAAGPCGNSATFRFLWA